MHLFDWKMNQPVHNEGSRLTRVTQSIQILTITIVLNLLLYVPLIVAGLWLAFRHHIDCLIFLEGPTIFIGITLFLTSIVGAVGVTKCKLVLIWAYLIMLLFLLLLLFCFTLFGFFVSISGGGHKGQSYMFKEYHVSDYSQWF